MAQKLTITIIAYNNEDIIGRTLASASFADEVILVDSNSSDRTAEIAKEMGAKVYQAPFKNYGHQKNVAASYASHDWILNIDSDEVISTELKESVTKALNSTDGEQTSLFSVNRLNHYCGKPIKNGGWFPDYNTRLYHKERASWTEPNVHEKLVCKNESSPKKISGLLLHYTFDTVTEQVNTNMRYAAEGARDLIAKKRYIGLPMIFIKPVGKFLECYLIKLGLLDGYYGLIIALNAAHSIFVKYVIARQLAKKASS
jgi:glycosyltransferase involved in cell wall biosynthesis